MADEIHAPEGNTERGKSFRRENEIPTLKAENMLLKEIIVKLLQASPNSSEVLSPGDISFLNSLNPFFSTRIKLPFGKASPGQAPSHSSSSATSQSHSSQHDTTGRQKQDGSTAETFESIKPRGGQEYPPRLLQAKNSVVEPLPLLSVPLSSKRAEDVAPSPRGSSSSAPSALAPSRNPSPASEGNLQGKSALGGREKVDLFKRLFAGRDDVWAKRWESGQRAGYSPVCLNLWASGICAKPKGRCSGCAGKSWARLTQDVIYKHLAGKHVVAVFPLFADGTCKLACVDFTGREWKDDALAFSSLLEEESLPSLLEKVSWQEGVRFWFFFSNPVLAVDARDLLAALLAKCSATRRPLPLNTYASIRPSEGKENDGLGRPVPLPLQLALRPQGLTVFLDRSTFKPLEDQWQALLDVKGISQGELALFLERLRPFVPERHAGGANGYLREQNAEKTTEALPSKGVVKALLEGMLSLKLDLLSGEQISEIKKLASFPNPEFAKAKALKLSTWNIEQTLVCYKSAQGKLSMPRGCLEQIRTILARDGYGLEIEDRRSVGQPLKVSFKGSLRPGQEEACSKILQFETGVLSAPTAFGKTVLAAAMIAKRKVSTLILVHREQLLSQWLDRLSTFLTFEEGGVGVYGGRKKKEGRVVDIAIIQSVQRLESPGEWMKSYGQIIVDECHHVAALTFERILRVARARYILGLTATPVRRDSLQPIIFMQCGPLRYCARREESGILAMKLRVRKLWLSKIIPNDVQIQEVYRTLAEDAGRNKVLVSDICSAFSRGGKVLALTERLEHLGMLEALLRKEGMAPFVLHGRQGAKERKAVMGELEALDADAPRIVLATGKLVGEGFDHPPLDTLVLALPISWKGNLQQYVGRLHRSSSQKSAVRVFDYVEQGVEMLERMWKRRKRGYEDMGYEIEALP